MSWMGNETVLTHQIPVLVMRPDFRCRPSGCDASLSTGGPLPPSLSYQRISVRGSRICNPDQDTRRVACKASYHMQCIPRLFCATAECVLTTAGRTIATNVS